MVRYTKRENHLYKFYLDQRNNMFWKEKELRLLWDAVPGMQCAAAETSPHYAVCNGDQAS